MPICPTRDDADLVQGRSMRPINPGEFTTADLGAAPDEGARYELVDGVLLVTYMSSRDHQLALGDLVHRLATLGPDHLEVLPGPLEFRPSSRLALAPAYWLLDVEEGTLTVLEFEGGRHVERAVVGEGAVLEAEVPFSVRVGISRSEAW